jgi:hypothetical protein
MNQEKHQKWEEHIRAWRQSDLTQTEYCRRHNLKRQHFYYQKKKWVRRKDVVPGRAGAGETMIAASEKFVSLPLQLDADSLIPGNTGKLEIFLSNGVRLVVPESFEAGKLVDLVCRLKGL